VTNPANFPERLEALSEATPARLTLARAGYSPTTAERLRFAHDHSLARDAVRRELDADQLRADLQCLGISAGIVRSRARDFNEHLQRPDNGRRLCPEDRVALGAPTEIVFIVADGLSAGAAERYAPRLLEAYGGVDRVVIVRRGRVAIGDEIGEALGAQLAVVLIGERPGLSAAESLGAYITYGPVIGRTDAERICISNIRDQGNRPENAALSLREAVAAGLKDRKTGL